MLNFSSLSCDRFPLPGHNSFLLQFHPLGANRYPPDRAILTRLLPMSSLRRILASRANGSRSQGPSTEAGKQRSSQNALVHGLLARCLLLDDESPEAFKTLLEDHIQRYRPADPVEFGFIEEMVGAAWRLRRAWAIETRMLDSAAAAAAPGAPLDRIAGAFQSLSNSAALPLMHRYETRLHTIYQRALQNLLLLRAAVPNEPNPVSEHSPDVEPLPLPTPEEP